MKANLETYQIGIAGGLSASLCNYGARLMSLFVPVKDGSRVNVVLGFREPENYFFSDEKYFGAIVGRYCNRIAKGRFELNGRVFQLATNLPPHHLHGGVNAFHSVIWESRQIAENAVEFRYLSPDGEEGYPGNLDVRLIYAVVENELHISMRATTDKTTIVNLTAHPFFNLKGEGSGDVLDHWLRIEADAFTPVDETLIPTGEIRPVDGSAFDFREGAVIRDRLFEAHPQLAYGNGFDHNYVLNKSEAGILSLAAAVREPDKGLTMEVLTTEPGMQFYTANWLSGKDRGYGGNRYEKHGALCLEPQHFPDSPNKAHFPPVLLLPGDRYHTKTVFRFTP